MRARGGCPSLLSLASQRHVVGSVVGSAMSGAVSVADSSMRGEGDHRRATDRK